MGRDIFHRIWVLTLNTSRCGTSTASLGNLFQCLNTLTVKKFLPNVQSKLTLPQFETIAPCFIIQDFGEKSPFLISPLSLSIVMLQKSPPGASSPG